MTNYSFYTFVPNKEVINTKKLHINDFKGRFKKIDSISINDILSFYRELENNVKKTTVNWRIYELVNKGVIQRIGRGKYRLGKQKEFKPLISEDNQFIYSKLKEEFPFLDISIWSTKWIAQWMLHIPNNYETIIEVEKGSEENVFYFLSDIRANVFLNPSKDILNKYANKNEETIIIKNLVTDSPTQNLKQIVIPCIEKIIVDLIVDDGLFSAYQGRDLDSIIENAFQHNTIKKDTLLRYAGRRGKKALVENRIFKTALNDFI